MTASAKRPRRGTPLLLDRTQTNPHLSVQQDIGRLDVPVEHVERVHVAQPLGHVEGDAGDGCLLQRSLPVDEVLKTERYGGVQVRGGRPQPLSADAVITASMMEQEQGKRP